MTIQKTNTWNSDKSGNEKTENMAIMNRNNLKKDKY